MRTQKSIRIVFGVGNTLLCESSGCLGVRHTFEVKGEECKTKDGF